MRPALLLVLVAACGPDAQPQMMPPPKVQPAPPKVEPVEARSVRLIAVSPAGGSSGMPVELLGSGFSAGLEVRFGGELALRVEVVDDGHARCAAPDGVGLVDVHAGDAVLPAAFHYEADIGTPPLAPETPAPAPARTLEAEAFTSSQGVTTLGTVVGYVDDGDWLAFAGVDFGTGAPNTLAVTLAAPAANAGQRLELHLDTADGALLGTLTVASTGGWEVYARQQVSLAGSSGVHALVVVARGTRDVANLDRLELNR